jgi:predicted nucleic acid-binding protein
LIAVLDACVLYSAMLRDLWMRLVIEEAIDARWTHLIHEEWTRNALKNGLGSKAQWENVVKLMNNYARHALVMGFEPLIKNLNLPDPDDRHILATAIHCSADTIITLNLKDFPRSVLEPLGIRAIHPDDFLLEVMGLHLKAVLLALHKQRAQLKNPAMTAQEFLELFSKNNLPRSSAYLRQFIAEI